jgi:hypothetical protein
MSFKTARHWLSIPLRRPWHRGRAAHKKPSDTKQKHAISGHLHWLLSPNQIPQVDRHVSELALSHQQEEFTSSEVDT